MFRAPLCSSSVGQIVLVQHLVSSLYLGDCSVHRLREANVCIRLEKKKIIVLRCTVKKYKNSLPCSHQPTISHHSEPDQCSTCLHPTSRTSILILSFHLRLGLPSGLFLSVCPQKLCMHLSSRPHVPHAPTTSYFFVMKIDTNVTKFVQCEAEYELGTTREVYWRLVARCQKQLLIQK